MTLTSHSHLVVLADGDTEAQRYITRSLRSSGYRVVVADSTDELLALEAKEQPEVVLLDEKLPGSLDAVRRLREASTVPIIFMSFVNESVAAQGLRVGADAVLMKPFSGELLLAHLESAIRRMEQQPPASNLPSYVYDELRIDFGARSVTIEGRRIHLSLREYRLLQILAMHAGRVLTHDQLLRLVWGPGYEESGDLLRGYIRNLRRKVGDDARNPRLIYTESQVGYWVPQSEKP